MYIGNDLQIAHPSYKIIDDISSGFNGNAVSFALQVNGESPVPFPISTQQVTISVNGVIQEPDPSGSAGFKLLGSNIVFSSAPANGHAFFGVINAGADYVTAGSEFPDGSVTSPSFTFQADQDTGWFRSGSGDVGYSSNGVAILNFNGNGLTIAAGKGLTVDTNTLHVDATNNRVGIGTTSPSRSLDINSGTVNVVARFKSTDATAVALFEDDSGSAEIGCTGTSVVFLPDGNEKMRLDSSGRLLLGTTTEGNANGDDLTISKDSGAMGMTLRSGDSSNCHLYFSDATSGTGEYAGYIAYQHSDNSLQIGTASTERMRIDSAGRVLLGTTTEGDASGDDLTIATTGNTGITIRSGTSNTGIIMFSDATSGSGEFAGYIEYNHSNNNLKLYTNGGQSALTLDSSQNATFASAVNISAAGATRCNMRHSSGGNFVIKNPTAASLGFGVNNADDSLVINNLGNVVCTGTVSDSKGNLRSIPRANKTSSYTLVASDAGKCITASTGTSAITVPTSTMAEGDAVTIYNNTSGDITITQGSSFTLNNSADATTGNRILATKGLATIWFVGTGDGVISGAGLS